MRRTTFAIVLLAAAATSSPAGFTGALDPLTAAVADRRLEVDTATRAGRRAVRTLDRVHSILAAPSDSVADDLRLAKRGGGKLVRRFPGDETFDPLLDQTLDTLETLGDEQRDGLARWRGRLVTSARERKLERALSGYDGKVARADEATSVTRRARLLHGACRRLDKVERRLDIEPLPPDPAGVAPDFALPDVNPQSPTNGAQVSPRDFLGKISAWYFGAST